MSESGRPNPESLLEVINRAENRARRGRLKVFLGMCPGVGKTYSMLKAAHEQQGRGVRVAIGVVETHGRAETEALMQNLPIIPKKSVDYKGTQLWEMDLDQILTQAPELVLVDELAHSNAPTSRHDKRHQDVEELLAAGIDVYTTVNIQHIESRNDQVAQITGVIVRETVPDSVLEMADQIEVIDLSPSELLYRLQEGKVYLGDRALKAQQNFFKEESLTALRELALRLTAEKVDQELSDQMTLKGIEGPWNTNERLLVAISHSPYSNGLIRATRRMAYGLEAPWIALNVDTGQRLTPEDQETLRKNLALARELGAELVTIADPDVGRAIQTICRDKNVTQIVMGRPDRRFFSDIFSRGTLLDQLVRTTSRIDVHVIRAERAPRYRGFRLPWPVFRSGFFPYYNAFWFIAVVTVVCWMAQPFVGYRILGSIYLLSILTVAGLTGTGPILFTAVLAALAWDFLFIPPQFTLIITSGDDMLMVFSFFVTALVGGLLTARIRRQEEILQVRESRARSLYELGRSLADARDENHILRVLITTVRRQFNGHVRPLLRQSDGHLANAAGHALDEKEFAVAHWVFTNNRPAGWSTATLSGSKSLCLPLRGETGLVGVVALFPGVNQSPLSIEQSVFLNSVLSQVSLAIERLRFREDAHATKLYEASEQLHQTLLNSISHEIRTPLTVVMGAVSALENATVLPPAQVRALGRELVQAADRLNRVTENLLDMSRLNSGVLALKIAPQDVRELIQACVHKMEKNLLQHTVKVDLPSDCPPVLVDFTLFEHALLNLLFNAVAYTPAGATITIRAEFHVGAGRWCLIVEDEGPGIPEESRTRIFDKFYRIPGTPTGGTGLGLSIVKSIVEAHHGNVHVEPSFPKGARFVIDLPLTNQRPMSQP